MGIGMWGGLQFPAHLALVHAMVVSRGTLSIDETFDRPDACYRCKDFDCYCHSMLEQLQLP